MKKFLSNSVVILYSFIILFIFISIVFFNNFNYFTKKKIVELNHIYVLIGIAIFSVIYIATKLFISKFINISFKKIIIILLLIYIVHCYIVYSYYIYTGFDIQKVIENSFSLANNGTLIEEDKWYFSTYPNNILMLKIFSTIIKISYFLGLGSYAYFIIIAIILCLSYISLVLLFYIVKYISNSNILSVLSSVFYILLILISPILSVPYSDSFGLIIPLITLFIYKIYIKTNKKILIFLLGLIGLFSIYFKGHTSIVFLSIIIYELLLNSSSYKAKIKFLLITILALVTSNLLITSYTRGIEIDKEKNIGYLHYIKMGLNENTNGLYSTDDYIYSVNFTTKKERDKNNLIEIKERIRNYDLSSYLKHVQKATVINFNDGTFGWYWIVDNNKDNFAPNKNTILSNTLNNIYISDGNHHKYFYVFHQIVWLMVVLCCVFNSFCFTNKDRLRIVVYISVVGYFLFVTLFETNPKYIFTNVPIFIICAMYGVQNLIEIKNRIFNKKN